jgi:hypothetical protein
MESPDPHKDASDWILKGGATADDIKARALEARMYVAPDIEQRQHGGAPPPQQATTSQAPPKEKPKKFAEHRYRQRRTPGRAPRPRHPPRAEWKTLDGLGRPALAARSHARGRAPGEGDDPRHPRRTKNTLMNAEEREKLRNFAKKSESNASINNMISRARAEPGVSMSTEQLDAHPWLLNLKNGTLDLRTRKLRRTIARTC